jgi:hypothetical protein
MNTGTPTESELSQLSKLHAAAVRRGRYSRVFLLLNLLFLIYTFVFGAPNLYVIAVYALVLLYMIYLSLIAPLLTRCPRCQRRMTLLRGRCIECGIDLGPAALRPSVPAQSAGDDAGK